MRFLRGIILGTLLLAPLHPAPADHPPLGASSLPAGMDRPDTGELRIALHTDALTLNPVFTAAPATTVPGAQLFASLFLLDAAGEPHPYLARAWHLSDDGLRLRVELVENARFHDDAPVTARDVAFSILAVRDHHSFNTMLAAVAGVDTPDSHTVVVRLRHPHPALFLALSAPLTPILPAHVYDDGRALAGHPANLRPVGSGPFRFVGREPDGRLLLARVDDFFLGRPALARLVIDYYQDVRQLALAMAAGEHQLALFVTLFDMSQTLQRLPGWLVEERKGYSGVPGYQINLAFNLNWPPLADRRVRQAIAHALDREYLYGWVFEEENLALGPFHPAHPYATPVMERYPLDVARANRLLETADLPRDAGGERFRMEFLLVHTPRMEALADYLRWDLGRKLGIRVVPVFATDIVDWQRRLMANDFQVGLDLRLAWGDPLLGMHRIYHSDAIRRDGIFTNYAHYAEPEVDRLLAQAGRTHDPAARAALYRRFAERVAEDLPYLWLSYTPLQTVQHRDLIFPTDSPWAATQPYHRVRWRGSGP